MRKPPRTATQLQVGIVSPLIINSQTNLANVILVSGKEKLIKSNI